MCSGTGYTATLRFQPTKRPQLPAQKQAQKIAQAKAAAITASLAASAQSKQSPTIPEAKDASQQIAHKTTIADWTGDGDDDEANGFFGGEKRQRGGRKKRKKNKEGAPIPQNWDDIYDPSRPNSYDEYKNSDEKIREVREWKDKLYAHRIARSGDYSDSDDDDDDRRPQMSSKKLHHLHSRLLIFAQDKFAPPSMSFAPPPIDDEPPPPPPPPPAVVLDDASGDDAYARRMRMSQQPYQPPPPPPAEVADDATGEDAYARRLKISQQKSNVAPGSVWQPPPPPPIATQQSTANAPSATIARAPVRYNFPAAPPEIPKSEAELEAALQEENEQEENEQEEILPSEDAPRSLRPGQKGFAERLMNKYGWSKGTGLGANSRGIINPLRVQVEKQKKKSDAEGGGFVGPGGRGKIIGGKKKGGEEEHGKFGPMSDVVILKNMLDGLDIDYELGEGNLMQEIGEECGEKVSALTYRLLTKLKRGPVRPGRAGLYRPRRAFQRDCLRQVYQSAVSS